MSVAYLLVHFRCHRIPPPLISSVICIMGKVDPDYPSENSNGTTESPIKDVPKVVAKFNPFHAALWWYVLTKKDEIGLREAYQIPDSITL